MDSQKKQRKKFLFKVDILIEEETNGRALEALLHVLNSNTFEDYQIREGIELGRQIEQSLKETILQRQKAPDFPQAAAKEAKPPGGSAKEAAAPPAAELAGDQHRQIWEEMKRFQTDNTLIRLHIIKAKGVKLSMPCRIINIDPPSGNLSVYHVDEKKVYLLKINEIDDYEVR
ncbi:hypothetical protein SAMN02799630_02568 [Paenibacillus sp. UNCCL117]|uniref:hypothetical protein n=1 Tax=unclassified Paenibacillus TaxID=185978 RepID=UPI0008904987|nr:MULTISPECIES: hypothetical protein [unclassified Paenibacillus]SDC06210.1 hypothetical protein SAMN04488602_101237 [Paenibacillus sp. cl123]SFW37765.1 hypothetical protein SAMN02799630_02568 [Paenibacillus sp. UNCCL117]